MNAGAAEPVGSSPVRVRPSRAVVIWFALLGLFLVDTWIASTAPRLRLDMAVIALVRQHGSPAVDLLHAVDSWKRNQMLLAAVVAVIAAAILDVRGAAVILSGGFASIWSSFLKPIVDRPTPGVLVLDPNAHYSSYPSGHATFVTWLLVLTAYVLASRLPAPLRMATWLAVTAAIVTVGAARIWSLAHWPSDVAGGILLGLLWSMLVVWAANRLPFGHRRAESHQRRP